MFYCVFLLFLYTTTFAISEVSFDVMLDIHYLNGTEPLDLICVTRPLGPMRATEDQTLYFGIQVPSSIKEFWCVNTKGKLIYNSSNDDEELRMWITNVTIFSKADMRGEWACKYRIKKPTMEVKAPSIPIGSELYVEGSCRLELEIDRSNLV